MATLPETVFAYLDRERRRHLEELMEFLRFPSVSTESAHRQDVARCAEWLAMRMRQAGLKAAVYPTGGHPVVVGRAAAGSDRPTVLVYGHYDVQPVDPLDQWRHPPFAPVVEDGYLWARGASDDKGQFFLSVIAAEAWLQAVGALPVNVVWVCEGEEEIGSPHLEPWLRAHRHELTADVALISDTPMFGPDHPAICYGLRGLVTGTITVTGPRQDLHSGVFGGAVANPARVLAQILAALHDADGRVTIPGFYDRVRVLNSAERARLAALPFDAARFREEAGIAADAGEIGYSVLERVWARPTLEINGIASGFQGEGYKTVIPARAEAKISARLVPDQDPTAILDALEAWVQRWNRPEVTVRFERGEAAAPALLPLDHPALVAADDAIRRVFGVPALYIRMGGTIPVVPILSELLGAAPLLVGFGLPDDQFHAPNERWRLDLFERGAKTVAALWAALAA
ncbi:MAG: dipeptidase [Firmicutes bacterium]|nr:dipeptidase [Alicyclobacillaceae bacterium]MCL6496599.1 dipeptidase [Bacillota bacterium]